MKSKLLLEPIEISGLANPPKTSSCSESNTAEAPPPKIRANTTLSPVFSNPYARAFAKTVTLNPNSAKERLRLIPSSETHLIRDLANGQMPLLNYVDPQRTPLGGLLPRYSELVEDLGRRLIEKKLPTLKGFNNQSDDNLAIKQKKSDSLAQIRGKLKLPKWLPLSQVAGFASIMKVLQKPDQFSSEYHNYLASHLEINDDMQILLREANDTRDKKLEHLIQFQTADINDGMRELISNGIDACYNQEDAEVNITINKNKFKVTDNGCGMSPDTIFTKLLIPAISSKDGENNIGRFGVGFFTALKYLQTNQDHIDIKTNDGEHSTILRFQRRGEFDNEIAVSIKKSPNKLPQGTSIEIYNNNIDHDALQEIVDKFTFSEKVKIYQNYPAEERKRINPSLTDPQLIIPTKHGEVKIRILKNSAVNRYLVNGIYIDDDPYNDHDFSFIIDYPNTCNLSLDRNSIAFDSVFAEINNALIDAIFSSTQLKITEQCHLVDTLASYFGDSHSPLAQSLLNKLTTKFKQSIDLSEYTVLPKSKKEILSNCEINNPLYLKNFSLLGFNWSPENISDFKAIPNYKPSTRYLGHKIFSAKFKDKEEFCFEDLENNSIIVINSDIYEHHKHHPETMNVYFSNLDHSISSGQFSICEQPTRGRFLKTNEKEVQQNLVTNTKTFLADHFPQFKTNYRDEKNLEILAESFLIPNQGSSILYNGTLIKARPSYFSSCDVDQKINDLLGYKDAYFRFKNSPVVKQLESSFQNQYRNENINFNTDEFYATPCSYALDGNNSFYNPTKTFLEAFMSYTEAKEKILSDYVYSNINTINKSYGLNEETTIWGLLSRACRVSDQNFKNLLPLIFDHSLLNLTDHKLGKAVLNKSLFFDNDFLDYAFSQFQGMDEKQIANAFLFMSYFINDNARFTDQYQKIYKRLINLSATYLRSLSSEDFSAINETLSFEADSLACFSYLGYRDDDLKEVSESTQMLCRAILNYSPTNIRTKIDLSQKDYKISLKLTELVVAKELNWSKVSAFNDDNLVDFSNFIQEVGKGKDTEEYKRTIHHLINSQMVNDPWVWLKECAQNSLDAMLSSGKAGQEITIEPEIIEQNGQKLLSTTFSDPVGMTTNQIFNFLLIPNETTKANNPELTGKFGQGFFTIFNGAKEVRVKTSTGNGQTCYLKIIPLDINGKATIETDKIADLEIQADLVSENFQGTQITKIQDSKEPELEQAQLKKAISQKLSTVKAKQAQIILIENQAAQTININKDHITKNVEIPNYGTLSIIFDNEKKMYQNGLFVSKLPYYLYGSLESRLLKQIPYFSIVLPKSIQLDKSRTKINNSESESATKILEPYINQILVNYLLEKFTEGTIDFFELLPYDFFTKKQAINQKASTEAEYLSQGQGLQDTKIYSKNPNFLMQIFRSIKFIEYNGKKISLIELSKIFQKNPNIDISQLPAKLQSLLRGAKLELIEAHKRLEKNPNIEREPIEFSFNVKQLSPEPDSKYQIIFAIDYIRKLLLEKMGATEVDRRYYYSDDGANACAHQNQSIIYWNMYQNTLYQTLCDNLLILLKRKKNQEPLDPYLVSTTFEEMIKLESHEKVHTFEKFNSETHNYKFFEQQRRLLTTILKTEAINPDEILETILKEYPDIVTSLMFHETFFDQVKSQHAKK